MKDFYLVCGWDHYYPSGGIQGIKFVTLNYSEALIYLEGVQKKFDNAYIYKASDLPWTEEQEFTE